MRNWPIKIFVLPTILLAFSIHRPLIVLGGNSAKAESANSSLKIDLQVVSDDSKRVRKDRRLLREAYESYVEAFNKHGHGSKQAMGAARKVMTIQSALHEDLAYQKNRQTRLHPAQTVAASSPSVVAAPETVKTPVDEPHAILLDPTQLKDEPSTANTGAEDYYNEVVKQFGEDSPQAQAVKNQMKSNP